MVTVLVAYASKHGATGEIASLIGTTLREKGCDVAVVPVERAVDVTVFDAVVLGSAIYGGRWVSTATAFLCENAHILAEKATWIFASGPTERIGLSRTGVYPHLLKPYIERVTPRDTVLFGGCIHLDALSLPERIMFQASGNPAGDFRDFEQIVRWAQQIAAALIYDVVPM